MEKVSYRKLLARIDELEEENCNLQTALAQVNVISAGGLEEETTIANGLGSFLNQTAKSVSQVGSSLRQRTKGKRVRRYSMSAFGKHDEDDNVYPSREFAATSKTKALMDFRRYLRETGRNPRDYQLVAEDV
jgi:hypothetical protein